MNEEFVYRVCFKDFPIEGDPRLDFYFTSLSAIYELFTAEQIGCKVSRLWNIGVSKGEPYEGRRCTITKEPITRKKRTNAPQSPEREQEV